MSAAHERHTCTKNTIITPADQGCIVCARRLAAFRVFHCTTLLIVIMIFFCEFYMIFDNYYLSRYSYKCLFDFRTLFFSFGSRNGIGVQGRRRMTRATRATAQGVNFFWNF